MLSNAVLDVSIRDDRCAVDGRASVVMLAASVVV